MDRDLYIEMIKTLAISLNDKYSNKRYKGKFNSAIEIVYLAITLTTKAINKSKNDKVNLTTDEIIDIVVSVLLPINEKLYKTDSIYIKTFNKINEMLQDVDAMSPIIGNLIDMSSTAVVVLSKPSFWKKFGCH